MVTKKADKAADTVQTTPEREPMADTPSAAPALDVEKLAPDANTEVDQTVLLQMRRDAPLHDDGPITADVHPDEVVNWLAAGWVLSPLPQGEGEGEGD